MTKILIETLSEILPKEKDRFGFSEEFRKENPGYFVGIREYNLAIRKVKDVLPQIIATVRSEDTKTKLDWRHEGWLAGKEEARLETLEENNKE
jgi:hypothetical protein